MSNKKREQKLEARPTFSVDFKQQIIPQFPDEEKKEYIDIKYPLIPPYAYAHIFWDDPNKELVYFIEEPVLNKAEENILQVLEDGIKELINISYIGVKSGETVIEYLEKNINTLIDELQIEISKESYLKIMYFVYRDFVGLNEIEPMLNDYFIEDIECNGINSPIYIVHRKYRNLRTNINYKDADKLALFVEKLAQKCGQYISYATPLLDGALPDGSVDYNEQFIYKENNKVKTAKIGDFVDKFYKEGQSNIPIKVKSLHVPAFDKDMKTKWRKIDYVYRHKINEDLYELKIEAGRKVKLTGAHSIFVLRKDKINAERVENVKQGDYVVAPLNLPENNTIKEFNLVQELSKNKYHKKILITNIPSSIFKDREKEIKEYYSKNYKRITSTYYEHKNKRILPIELYNLLSRKELRKCKLSTTSGIQIPTFLEVNKELMRLLGYYIGEGWIYNIKNHYRISFCFNKNENNYIKEVNDSFVKCFSNEIYKEPEDNNAVKLTINSLLIYLVFKDVLKISKGAKNKEVPELIFNVNKKLQQEFIRAWHNSDFGSTTSKKLANDISYLSLFNSKIVPFYQRDKQAILDNRKIISHEIYTNYYRREISDFHTMIPMNLFNPLNKLHHRLKNSKIRRSRLRKLLDDIRFNNFNNLQNVKSDKFIEEWTKRGAIKNIGGSNLLTKEGQDAMYEHGFVKKLIESDLVFLKINKINRVKSDSQYVYDVSVPGCENFVAGTGGVFCHNSRVNATFTEDISSKGPTFCFKDGYVQLGDGQVKKVNELFDGLKKNFGSKFEDGNEIVEVSNVSICGVDENSLNNKLSKMKSIIKIKPPKKVVKIYFDDGGEVEVTQNHLFHVADDSLKLIEAKNLKEDMLVPIPNLIKVTGYRQKIDVYSTIKDFSYSNKICIISNENIKEIINQEISLNKTQNNFRQILSQKYGVGDTYFYEIINKGSSVSFSVIDKICENQNIEFNNLEGINITVYGGGTKNKTKTLKVPPEINENLAYLAGALISDGHLCKDYIGFSCYEQGFKTSVKEKLLNIFGRFDSYYNDNRIYLCNKFVPFFFNKIFEIPIGKKSHTVKVPQIIFKSDNKAIASFIRGLFDGDGTISSGLSYKSYSKELVEGLSYLLARLGIYSYIKSDNSKNGWRLNIPSPYYKKYFESIGFDSYYKKERLEKVISKQVDKKQFIRHNRIPSKIIFNIINKLNLSINKLTKECGVSYNRRYYSTFSKSFANKFLNYISSKYSLTKVKEEVDYLKWLLESGQEYVRISKVEILENKDPLYDIELEPCKFFVAGNKPMNMFDTIRKFTKNPWTPTKLMQLGTISPQMLAYLWILIEYENNIMVIGGTGSGKTTLLNALTFFIPPQARVVSIEDTRELNLDHENWLPAVSREGVGLVNLVGQKYGEVSLFDLLRESFRQRPDYVIVGEVRGKEAYVLFQGMASGHPSFGTMHANSVETLIRRLETAPINLSSSLVEVLDAVIVVIQTKMKGESIRRIREISEIISIKEGLTGAVINNPFIWNPQNDTFLFKSDSYVFKKIMLHHGISKEELFKELELRAKLLIAMYKKGIFGFKEVRAVINEYYKDSKYALKKYGVI